VGASQALARQDGAHNTPHLDRETLDLVGVSLSEELRPQVFGTRPVAGSPRGCFHLLGLACVAELALGGGVLFLEVGGSVMQVGGAPMGVLGRLVRCPRAFAGCVGALQRVVDVARHGVPSGWPGASVAALPRHRRKPTGRLPLGSVGMSRFRSAALAPAVVVLAFAAAGCSSGNGHSAAATTTAKPTGPAPCKLTRAQRQTVAIATADIGRLRRIEAPVQSFSQRGAPHQEQLTGKFLLDLGSTKLPINVFSRLLHQAKVATRLCGDCGSALETEEPVLGSRSGLTDGQGCG